MGPAEDTPSGKEPPPNPRAVGGSGRPMSLDVCSPRKVSLAPARHTDWPQIDRWLTQSEIAAWWGSYTSAQASVLAAMNAPMALCSLVLAGNRAVGYGHALEDDRTALASGERSLTGCYRIEVFIGEREARGLGIGEAALGLVCDEIFATTLVPSAFAVVPLRNEAAVRVHEKAGFKWLKVIDDPNHGPCWILRRDRARR